MLTNDDFVFLYSFLVIICGVLGMGAVATGRVMLGATRVSVCIRLIAT